MIARGMKSTEPGIRHGNEDFDRNENQKSWKDIFSVEKKSRQAYFFFL